jgi:hypothetical protein
VISLAPEFALAFVLALCGAVGSFVAVRLGLRETRQLLVALHARFDRVEARVRSVELQQARDDERIKGLRNTQRFRLRTANGPEIGGGGEG